MNYQTSNGETPHKRLADMMAAAIISVGKAASTDTGKMLFAMAYDADCMLDCERRRLDQYEGKRPTKASQETKYYEGMDLGKRNAYADALAAMASEMGGYEASAYRCRRVINSEIQMMRDRTDEQQQAAPITALFAKAIDW